MTVEATMRALKIVGQGVTEIRQVPVPNLEPDTVLIAVRAIALNPTDWYYLPSLPLQLWLRVYY